MGYQNLSVDDYNALLAKVGKSYMPKQEKKPKLSLRQIFFLKKKFKKTSK